MPDLNLADTLAGLRMMKRFASPGKQNYAVIESAIEHLGRQSGRKSLVNVALEAAAQYEDIAVDRLTVPCVRGQASVARALVALALHMETGMAVMEIDTALGIRRGSSWQLRRRGLTLVERYKGLHATIVDAIRSAQLGGA